MHFVHFQHAIKIVCIYPSGDEEWYCPECHEHFFLSMPNHKIKMPYGREKNRNRGKIAPGSYPLLAESALKRKRRMSGSIDDPYLEPWKNFIDSLE